MSAPTASATTTSPLRILITGRDGQVGQELAHALAALGTVTATSRAELDLTSDEAIRKTVRRVRPGLIVNAAAYTAVDKAEAEPELAHRINADAVATLAAEANELGAAVIHYSTDYVFDGANDHLYVEQDAPGPLGVYGRTKLAGEQALTASGVPHLTLRTSWVYGARGKNFLLTILRLAAEKPELRIVADQRGAPTWSHDIASATAELVRRWMLESNPQQRRETSGIYHLTASGETTWFGFAESALQLRSAQAIAAHAVRITPISTAEYPAPAARPANSRLNCGKLARTFGVQLPSWDASLAQVMEQWNSSAAR